MSENNEKKGKGGAIGAVIGTVVLAAACVAGGWIARGLIPPKMPKMPQMPQMVATVCIAIWDGLVQARLDHFLSCDLGDTLRKSYEAVWQSIKT